MPDDRLREQMSWLIQNRDEALRIVPMENRHIPAVMVIEKQVQFEPWTEKIFRKEIEKNFSLCFVIERSRNSSEKSIVIGYLCAEKILDEVHLNNIAVARNFQRCGYGKALLGFLLSAAIREEASVIHLEVREDNIAAIKLYESFGFKITGKRPDYYNSAHGKCSAILMSLRL